jgi:hypothetical protein
MDHCFLFSKVKQANEREMLWATASERVALTASPPIRKRSRQKIPFTL